MNATETADRVGKNLVARIPMFYPDGDTEFRRFFRQRWNGWCNTRKRRLRVSEGSHKGVRGTFVWTEEIK